MKPRLVSLYKFESSFHNEFSVNSQQLLLINLIIFLALVFYFSMGRSRRPPVQLNLKANPPPPEPKPPQEEALTTAREVTPSKEKPVLQLTGGDIYFVYNGHEWEAHEVLGLKKNCSLQEATMQYQQLIKTQDPSSFEFYDSAYASLLKTKNKR